VGAIEAKQNTGEIAGATIENLSPAGAAQLGVPPNVHLVIVTKVESSAKRVGLLPGDILVAVDNEGVTNVDEVSEVAWRVGTDPVALSVMRDGETITFSVPLT
jgi:S1-C subfamily serine protease